MVCTRRSHLKHIPTDFERREEKRKEREVRMIKRRLGMDIRFRSTEDINAMLTTGRLGGKPVKFFIISAHGTISREKVFRMPPNMAVFDVGENEYRGRLLCSCHTQPLFNTIIGRHGTHRGSFFNAMLGGEYTPDPTSSLIPQIGYRTPGELAFDISLSIKDSVKGDLDDTLGCWDITDSISTFNPMDFARYRKGVYVSPNSSRFIENPYAPRYKREVNIMNKMDRNRGMYLSKIIRKLERKYPDTVCFISVACCMGLESPERFGTEYPEQPSAYTHYALKGETLGDPEVDRDCSMTCRDLDNFIEYGTNTSLSMVLRSSSTTKCYTPLDDEESGPYTPI
jgi:hypothetical protein